MVLGVFPGESGLEWEPGAGHGPGSLGRTAAGGPTGGVGTEL